MSETLILKARGLSRYSDPLSARPEGSLNAGVNIVIDQPGVFSPRRGFEQIAGSIPSAATFLIPYQDELLVYWYNSAVSDYNFSKLVQGSTTWSSSTVSGFTSSGRTARYAEALGNLYVIGDTGVYKLDDIDGSFVEAGVPQALGGWGEVVRSTGFLEAEYITSYRWVWGYKDANNNLILGSPSNPITIYNPAAATGCDVALYVQVPDEIDDDKYFLQLYRTVSVDGSIDELATTTGDLCRLVNEIFYKPMTPMTISSVDAVDAGNDLLTIVGHGLSTGQIVTLSTTGTLPNPLNATDNYYVIKASVDTIKLATSAAYAYAGTPAVNITDTGTGVHTVTPNNRLMHIIDETTDDLLEDATELYTNATREGISNANLQPPKCSDIAVFNNHAFYADLTYRHSYQLNLLAAGTEPAQGIVADATITIADSEAGWTETYTAKAAESLKDNQFKVESSTGFFQADIQFTAESLVRCINNNSEKVYAYYDSTANDIPGKIRIEERDFGGNAFTVLCTMPAGSYVDRKPFSPDVTSVKTSTSETYANRLAWSKYGEFEAVPAAQWFDIGSKSQAIKRIVALRDALFIIKEDGIARLTGTTSANFAYDVFDNSTRIISPESVVVLNNLIYGLYDQGVCTISESGVQIISRDIEGDLRTLVGLNIDNLKELGNGCSYESDRKYYLWLPQNSTDTYPTIGYVYNTLTSSWTTSTKYCNFSVVNPADDKLYIARGDTPYLSKERKSFSFRDYVDEQLSVVVLDSDEEVISLTSITGITVGDIYYESSGKFALITEIDQSNSTITVNIDLDFSSSVANSFTVVTEESVPTDELTVASHNYKNGLEVQVSEDIEGVDELPDGLAADTSYYVYVVDSNTIQLSTSKAAALQGQNLVEIQDTGTGTFTITPQIATQVLTAFRSTIEWNAVHLNSPAHLKQFYEANFLTSKEFRNATASFKSNLSGSWASMEFTGNPIGLWGLFEWGTLPWGGDPAVVLDHRTYVPREKQRASILYPRFIIDTAYADWELSGLELTYRNAGARGTVK